jgi:hypothetical protein
VRTGTGRIAGYFMKTARVVKWNRQKHAQRCIGCELDFKRGDSVVAVGCLTIHYRRDCAERYIADSKEIGIEPDIVLTLKQ